MGRGLVSGIIIIIIIIFKKNRAKKKKSGNLMKRAQKNFERDPSKKIFMRAKPYAVRKQKIMNKVRDLIIIIKKKKTRQKKKKVGKFDETHQKKF